MNICYNVLDKYVNEGWGEQVVMLWEGNDVGYEMCFIYSDVFQKMCQFVNYFCKWGVKKGDCVCIYMFMVFEFFIVMFVCVRIGVIYFVIFGGFSVELLVGWILDCKFDVLFFCLVVQCGVKVLNLKVIVDEVLQFCLEKESFQLGIVLIYDNKNVVLRSKVKWVVG